MGGPKGIMGVGIILLVSLTSAMGGILRTQQMVVLRSAFTQILARIQPLGQVTSVPGYHQGTETSSIIISYSLLISSSYHLQRPLRHAAAV